MEIRHLNSETIHCAILSACNFIINNRENLNAINLFPVADGDTGDNMSATALSMIHLSSAKPTLNETFQSLANSALLGARGNSGMIFSQFFNGLAETKLSAEQINTRAFADLISNASKSVRSAILHPVEGTMITVMDAWSTSTSKLAKEFTCFKKLIQHTLTEVNKTLQNTANILPVLKKAQVVDAGALGFYHFISGFADYLANPRPIDKKQIHWDCIETHHELPADGTPPQQRYCTEIMLFGASIDKKQIALQLEQFGDSVVSSGNENLCRFHLHCKEPADVFTSLFRVGKITQAKAEDMLRQFQMLHQRKYPIALVTDSSADIPQALLDEHQIHLIQLNMQLDGHHLLDRLCMHQDTFYDNLTSLKTYPTTSYPSPAPIEKQIGNLAKHYEQVLILPLSQALSGLHDAICKATAHLANVHVVNSCHTSAGLGLLVNHAAQLITTGHSIEEIKKELLLKTPKINFFVYVNHFDSLIRGGRISKLGGKIAQLAHVKPIITFDKLGKAILFDKTFSEKKGLRQLIHYVNQARQNQSLACYGIVHAGVPEKALLFAQRTSEAFNQPPAFIESASTAIGLHAGKGAIGLVSMVS